MEDKTMTLMHMTQGRVLNMLHSTMLIIIYLCEKQLPEATKLLYELSPDNKYTRVAMETMTYFVNAQIIHKGLSFKWVKSVLRRMIDDFKLYFFFLNPKQ